MVRFYRRRTQFRRRFPTFRRRTYGYKRRFPNFRRGRTYGKMFRKRRRLANTTLPRYKQATITRNPPVSPIMYTKFKMGDVWNLNIIAPNTRAALNIYLNNPYDPIVGASVSACAGYSQLMAVYKYCICFAVKVTCTFAPGATAQPLVFVYIAMDGLENLHPTGYLKDPLQEGSPLNLKYKTVWPGLNNQRTTTISMYRRIKTLTSEKDLEETQYRGTQTAGPTNLVYGVVGATLAGSGTVTASAYINAAIKITYYCKLYERNDITGSTLPETAIAATE